MLKGEFTGVGPKADEGLASESELVTFHPGVLTVSDEHLVGCGVTLGRAYYVTSPWGDKTVPFRIGSLSLRELGLKGCV